LKETAVRIRHTTVRGLVAAGATIALLTACGGGADPADEPSADGTGVAEDEPDEDAAPERADADLVVWADDVKAQALREPAARWADANGITVAVQSVSGDLRDLFITADQASNGPDVILGAHDWIGALVQNSAITPVAIPDTSDFSPTALDAITYEGQTFGVPYGVETLGLFANTALTAVPEPATIEELVEAGRAGGAENPLCLQIGLQGDAYHLQPLFTAGGGYVFGADPGGTLDPGDVGIDSEGGLLAAERIGALGDQGVLRTSVDGSNSIPLFADGSCAYLVSGPWAIAQVEEAGIDYVLGRIPGFDGLHEARPFATVNSFYLAANGQNPAFAQQFVADVAGSTEIVRSMFESNQMPPTQRSLMAELQDAYPAMVTIGELAEAADPMPAIPEMSAVWGPLGQSQAAVVEGADPRSTFTKAADEIRSATSS
jgi:arabinogalactan oligomer/maltooligosaccharide transport system substrate-binding protein